MAEPTTDEARDVRGLLHLAGTYATRAVAAAEAMEVAFEAMIRDAASSDEAVRDLLTPHLLTPHPTDWAARVEALAAASRACSELATARQEQLDVEMLDRLRGAVGRKPVIGYVAHPPGTDPMMFKPEDVDVVTAGPDPADYSDFRATEGSGEVRP